MRKVFVGIIQLFFLHFASSFTTPHHLVIKPFVPKGRAYDNNLVSAFPKRLNRARCSGVCGIRLQNKPELDKDTKSDLSGLFSVIKISVVDAAKTHKQAWSEFTGGLFDDADKKSFFQPLLSVPLWAGLVALGLFLPSPEMILNGFSTTQAVHSAPWDTLPSAAKDAAQVIPSIPNPFGTSQGGINLQDLANPQLDPNLFVPVCKFSDTFYRGAKNAVLTLAGRDVYQEYAPLIAGSLLRIRLEFCVLESFVYESIIPFIKARGLSWVFPLRETLETFVAGVVFAVASNVVLIGSTKIISIAIFYSDFFIGLPIRLTFGFINDRLVKSDAAKNPVGVVLIAATGAVRLVGQTTEVLRKFIEFWDVFVGRYLLLTTFGYVVLKFLKFKGVLTIEKLGAVWNALLSASDSVPQ